MNPFDDDFGSSPFDELVREFFGPNVQRRHNTIIKGEEEDRSIDYVEDKDYIYLVFELPGYDEDDVDVKVRGKELEVSASKKGCKVDKVQSYLSQKLCKGLHFKKFLPNFINPNKSKHSFKNGVLEIKFNKR